MLSSEAAGIYCLAPENQSPFSTNFGFMQNDISPVHLSRFTTNLPNSQTCPFYDFSPQSTGLSNNSTSDEAEEEHQLSIVEDRKQRRMISNRESARRSRMRKQMHLDELLSLVVRLRTEKHSLLDKLNHVSESHGRVLQENTRLKEETSDLRQMLTDVQLGSPFSDLRDLQEISCNTAHLSAESCNQSITTSTNLLL